MKSGDLEIRDMARDAVALANSMMAVERRLVAASERMNPNGDQKELSLVSSLVGELTYTRQMVAKALNSTADTLTTLSSTASGAAHANQWVPEENRPS